MFFKKLDKYFNIMGISLKSNIAYTGELIYRSLFMVLIIYVFINLWGAAYNGKSSIEGLTFTQIIWYLVMGEAIVMGKPDVAPKISSEVKDGTLAYTLGRPYSYLLYHFCNGIGESLTRFIINLIAGGILTYIMVGSLNVNLYSLLLISLTIIFALIIDFCISAIIGLTSFITEDITGFLFIYQKILFIMGGMLIPIDMLPNWLSDIFKALPFNLIVYAPSKLFVDFNISIFYSTILQQLIWIAIFVCILIFSFRKSIKRLSVNGG